MTTGEKIKAERKAAGMTQKELAEKSGLAIITIQQYEANKRTPRYENAMKVCSALELKASELFPYQPMSLGGIKNEAVAPWIELDLCTSIRLRRIAAKLNKPQEQVVKELVYGLYNLLRMDEGEKDG